MYSKAIEENPHVAAYYGNRSFAYLKTECFGYALNDASKAIELDETYVKVTISICFLILIFVIHTFKYFGLKFGIFIFSCRITYFLKSI